MKDNHNKRQRQKTRNAKGKHKEEFHPKLTKGKTKSVHEAKEKGKTFKKKQTKDNHNKRQRQKTRNAKGKHKEEFHPKLTKFNIWLSV